MIRRAVRRGRDRVEECGSGEDGLNYEEMGKMCENLKVLSVFKSYPDRERGRGKGNQREEERGELV